MLSLFSEYNSLEETKNACLSCIRCPLSAARQQVVFGTGSPDADIMFIGQGPSLTDDLTGLPYSGPASELLDTALTQAGIQRDAIWLTNLHKCIATKVDVEQSKVEQRAPKASEIKACNHWLEEELIWIKPRVLVAIGGPAAKTLISKSFQLSEQRGTWHSGIHGLPVLATFQPTYLKRLSQWDRPTAVQGWRNLIADLRQVQAYIEEK